MLELVEGETLAKMIQNGPLPLDRALAYAMLLLGTEFNERGGSFSPDGQWVAYVSNETGRDEVYVRPFVSSGPMLGEGKWQVSKDGVAAPVGSHLLKWRIDGKEIVFLAPNGSMMAVDVNQSGGAFQMGTAKQLFSAPFITGWDVTGDGKRFLMTVPPAAARLPVPNAEIPITVVLNWEAI